MPMAKIEIEELYELLEKNNPKLAIEFGLALDGLKPNDIAERTSTPLQTVYSHKKKIQELKHQYDKEGE